MADTQELNLEPTELVLVQAMKGSGKEVGKAELADIKAMLGIVRSKLSYSLKEYVETKTTCTAIGTLMRIEVYKYASKLADNSIIHEKYTEEIAKALVVECTTMYSWFLFNTSMSTGILPIANKMRLSQGLIADFEDGLNGRESIVLKRLEV